MSKSGQFPRESEVLIASHSDILRRASRVPFPRREGTRSARLRMSAGEARVLTKVFFQGV